MTCLASTNSDRIGQAPRLLLSAAAMACLLPVSAQALSLNMPLSAAVSVGQACATSSIAIEPAAAPVAGEGMTKGSAILGGQPSALDLIRQQQNGLDVPAQPKLERVTQDLPSAIFAGNCLIASPVTESRPLALAAPIALPSPAIRDEFLGTARVGIRLTPFNADWDRVSENRLSTSRVSGLIGSDAPVTVETLAEVNRWVNRRIQYADDARNWAERDYWASAEETLALGRGDCEDYAILKYQMLAALGFDRRDMYLTLARDLVRNADHAVLVVKIEGRPYMLDNATDILLPASTSYDYRPTMSFNSESAWLHGSVRRDDTAATIAAATQPFDLTL